MNKCLVNASKQSYKNDADATLSCSPEDGGEYILIMNSETLKAYLSEKNKTIIISVRGTKKTSWTDIYADLKSITSSLSSTTRYQKDKQLFKEVVYKYSPKKYNYILTGHSLGGGIVQQLTRDFPFINTKKSEIYNSAFQFQKDFGKNELPMKKFYMDLDPLYRVGGYNYKQNMKVLNTKISRMARMFTPSIFLALQGHKLENFE